ncbi:DUF2312 domain-containing protein [Rickettsia endosymbiont of Cardiosporidium cionae]|uniref:DUF2312 domain-containing protein n=1 Tax=Rickettsia endosymbiont of Cardiosporidium cionae TaxID=2777155 RepID=UPI0018932E40|nr:DUF2312 domain-containing protein [Rickettsia endosymbiont of Cardiosporidium cionae]KAF8818642.1 hypothetical protein IHI24_000364 [Rickettsia endosymbiont of Cardiosporidium cionae]
MEQVIESQKLKYYIDKIENLEATKKDILQDIKSVYDEAKSAGFDTRVMKEILRIKNIDKAKLEEHETVLELYKAALNI